MSEANPDDVISGQENGRDASQNHEEHLQLNSELKSGIRTSFSFAATRKSVSAVALSVIVRFVEVFVPILIAS